MSRSKQSAKRTVSRHWAAIAPILLLAPLSMAAKGCSSAEVGDDCPAGMICSAGAGNAGGAGAGAGTAGGSSAGNGGSPSAGSGGMSSSHTCGGLLGLTCGKTEYCDFPAATACGSGDQTGTCQAKPDACTLIYAPVCGCDGKTYGSQCAAASAGVSVAQTGACAPANGKACGGLLGATCAQGEYCEYTPAAMCGAADQTGTCTPVPGACDAIYDPVCGCDGKTYGNACAAAAAAMAVARTGACAANGAVCGGIQGKTCAASEYCNFPPKAPCGAGDVTGQCTPRPQACTDEVAPVCGCDGKPYVTACTANAAGISVLAPGMCK